MVESVTAHLVRRGLAAVSRRQQQQPAMDDSEVLRRLHSFGSMATLISTGILFLIVSFAVEYTIRFVIGNLAVVEDVQAANPKSVKPIFTGTKAYTDDVLDGEAVEKEVLLNEEYVDLENESIADLPIVPAKPITRSLRSARKHLRSVGGFRSRFRGLKYFIFFAVPTVLLRGFTKGLFRHFRFGSLLADIITVVATCRLRYVWTHATITAPSDKSYFQRILPRSGAKHLILPSIRTVIAAKVAAFASCSAFMLANDHVRQAVFKAAQDNKRVCFMNFAWFALPLAVGLFTAVFLVFPTTVALIRVEASLIPTSDDVIVPFDRTFGGRINWNPSSEEEENALNNSRCRSRNPKVRYVFRNLTLGGAWRTLDREAIFRVMKVMIKFFFISGALAVLFAHIFAFELYVILGDQVKPMLTTARQFVGNGH